MGQNTVDELLRAMQRPDMSVAKRVVHLVAGYDKGDPGDFSRGEVLYLLPEIEDFLDRVASESIVEDRLEAVEAIAFLAQLAPDRLRSVGITHQEAFDRAHDVFRKWIRDQIDLRQGRVNGALMRRFCDLMHLAGIEPREVVTDDDLNDLPRGDDLRAQIALVLEHEENFSYSS